ncbi:hypothetical protein ACFQS7_29350 [Dankookia sp. GCM10030260]|uniref:hypothetical protein n=1 Tax=Dankookia sp. GCM10030260 TaxID=3273390 RepID=UPI0036144A35
MHPSCHATLCRFLLVGTTVLVLAVQPAAAQAPSQSVARPDDQVVVWTGQLRAEADALRAEGADEVVRTLQQMMDAEARLLERLRDAPLVDALLPEMAQTWAEGADRLGTLAARMPEVLAAQRRRLASLRGVLGQAQALGRTVGRDVETMRAQLEQLRARGRAAAPGSAEAMKAEVEAVAQGAALTAREAQARLVVGFAAQAGQALGRLEDAGQGMELLAAAMAAHARVLQASSDLARTRLVARDALQMLATMAERLEGFDGVLQGLAQHWEALDGLLRRLGDLPAGPSRAGS